MCSRLKPTPEGLVISSVVEFCSRRRRSVLWYFSNDVAVESAPCVAEPLYVMPLSRSYDNFISMVADSMKFVGKALGLDCIAFTMVQHLCQTKRSFVSDSGLTLER